MGPLTTLTVTVPVAKVPGAAGLDPLRAAARPDGLSGSACGLPSRAAAIGVMTWGNRVTGDVPGFCMRQPPAIMRV